MITPADYRLPIAMMGSTLLHVALLACLGPVPQYRDNDTLQVRLLPRVVENFPQASAAQFDIAPLQFSNPVADPEADLPPAHPDTAESTHELQPAANTRQADLQPLLPLPDPAPPANRVEIEFEIFSGEDRKSLGTGLQQYQSDGQDRYQLSFKSTGQPENSATQEGWQLEIQGRIISNSLRPTSYRRQGSLASQLMALNDGSVQPAAGGVLEGRMPDGVADRFSMLYQFMFALPDATDGQFSLSDGENLETYNYHIAGMESMAVRSQGTIRVLHLTLTAQDHTETTELWLAPDFLYLPVKIRSTDAQGRVTEQEAISLAVN